MIRALTTPVLLVWTHVACDTGMAAGQSARADSTISRPSPSVFSIGQPPMWRQQLTAQGTAYSRDGRSGATFSYGLFHSLNKPPMQAFNPLIGVIGGTVEAYGSIAGAEDVGMRAMATSRMLATSVGADWDIRHRRVNTIVSWQSALLRGGLVGRGSMLRVDWIPARGQTLRVGFTAPLFDPLAGRTRPRVTTSVLPD